MTDVLLVLGLGGIHKPQGLNRGLWAVNPNGAERNEEPLALQDCKYMLDNYMYNRLLPLE